MADICFEHTKTALIQLENQLKCSICGVFANSPVTLGGCEHLFCNVCCADYLGKCCPICDIPAHVKDAEIDRQLYNIARLCQKLGSVLHGRNYSNSIKQNDSTAEASDGLQNQENNNQSTNNRAKRPSNKTKANHMEKALPTQDKKDSKKAKGKTIKGKTKSTNEDSNYDTGTEDQSVCQNEDIESEEIADHAKAAYTAEVKSSKAKSRCKTTNGRLGNNQQPKQDTDNETKKGKKDGRRTRSLEPRSSKLLSNKNTASTTNQNEESSSTNQNAVSSTNQNTESSSFGSHDMSCDPKNDETAGNNAEKCDETGQKNLKSRKRKSVENPVGGRKTRLRHSVGGYETSSKSRANLESESSEVPTESVQFTSMVTTEEKKTDEVKAKRRKSSIDTKPTKTKEPKAPKRRKSAGDVLTHTPEPKAASTPKSGCRSVQKSQPKASPAGIKNKGQIPMVDKRNAKGETALQVASIKNDIEKVRSLLAEGANPNIRDNAGWSPLHEACNHGYLEVATLLLDSGAMINVPGLDNDTALHDAVSNNKLECVKLLVSRGASLTLRNMSGYTAVDLATTDAMKQALATPVIGSGVNTDSQSVNVLEYQAPCLLGTGLSREEKVTLQKACRKLKVKQTDEVTPEVTHIVTRCNTEGMCPRTIKLLHGILLGKWIVTVEWLATCEEVGSLVCEEAFEVQGTSLSPNSQSPFKGRMNSRQQLPGLFNGCQFYFHGSFEYATPAKEDLIALIKAGDGQILVREPKPGHLQDLKLTVPYHIESDSDLADCGIFVVHENQVKFEPIRMKQMCSVPSSWIMDCVSYFKLMPLPPI